uniref:hypothetical protein n=1 Tax=Piscirickettsia salmonis TaxID=1238 RepID=UPI0039F738DD
MCKIPTEVATLTELIAKSAGDMVDAMIPYVRRLTYAQLFEEVAKRNPLQCSFCGSLMELWQLYHPSKGVFYDIFDPPRKKVR